jgi:hypothetical protein
MASWSSGLEPWLRPWAEWLVAVAGAYGDVRVTSVRRSRTQQLALWNNRHNNPYPVAPPGSSYHEYGRAWDMVGPDWLLTWAGALWKSVGGRWSARDPIHFEA